MKLFNNQYMELAINEAKKGLLFGDEIPVGCVIVNNNTNEILAISRNQSISSCDPTAHAEILAIREACNKLGNYRLENTSIFITLEPCKMCIEAIKQARIDNIYFGAYSNKKDLINHKINIISGLYEEECSNILKEFFKNKR